MADMINNENHMLVKRVAELERILRETENSLARCEFWEEVEQVILRLKTVVHEQESKHEKDCDPKTLQWRSGFTISEEKIVEREEYLHSCWSEETNDPETEEWRDELTEQEERMVDAWDFRYEYGIGTIAKEIVAAEEKNKQSVAAKLEAAKQQVAERAASAPPMEHTQSRSSGHSR